MSETRDARVFLMRAETVPGKELRRLIESHFECCSSVEIGEALKHLRFHNHDLIVCQLPLEDESAFGFLRSLQADARLNSIPRICINVSDSSARITQSELETAARLFGALDCVDFGLPADSGKRIVDAITRHLPKLVAEEKAN